eukprot:113976_1
MAKLIPPLSLFFRRPCLSLQESTELFTIAKEIHNGILSLETEFCYNVLLDSDLSGEETRILTYLLSETFEPENFATKSFLTDGQSSSIIEIGPRLNFTTAWSSNAVAVCERVGISSISRIERTRRLKFTFLSDVHAPTREQLNAIAACACDRMTECRYEAPLTCAQFDAKEPNDQIVEVPVLEMGRDALVAISDKLGFGFDEQDVDFYTDLFVNKVKRNPTTVECFDLAQGNSEHSRHWFFGGKIIIDGEEKPKSLFQMVKAPYKINPNNSVIAFHDNSSAQCGFGARVLAQSTGVSAAPLSVRARSRDFTLTAETHNFPTGICPFAGAETGPGGRIRDGHSTGRGSLIVAGMAGYCVGNLNIPGYHLPWEQPDWPYPGNMASPLRILVEASNGASDYGNKFGEPLIQGFTRSFGQRLPNSARSEWIKPIMFSSGVGHIDRDHLRKGEPEKGMAVVKLGGPAFRIGLGGGAASSMVQGDNREDLDFNAVQRGDAEMEQKTNRVIRACIEMDEMNPIVSIHDQGAGGSGNVLKEISEPQGAEIDIRKLLSGDKTLTVMELWGAEYQENDALLINQSDLPAFDAICARERSPYSVVGRISGTGRIVVHDSRNGTTPVDLDLKQILSDIPQKTFQMTSVNPVIQPLTLPPSLTLSDALDRVLRLASVGSKRFLTSKVDRSVTGLIAQQQCVGPLQLTLSDVAVTASSHFETTGCATSIGEQPLKGFLDPAAMARLCVAESLTNLVWAKITSLEHIKASGNWMWAAKLEGEGARMYEACEALSEFLVELGIAIDGGKDSLSMAARVPVGEAARETVKCPGSLVMSAYCACPDITLTVTPDLKLPGRGVLVFIDISDDFKLGGSALAQAYSQLGSECPDVATGPLSRSFRAVQDLLTRRAITAGHDRSDGGLIVTVLEMAFAGNCGVSIDLSTKCADPLAALFCEGAGLVMEVDPYDLPRVEEVLRTSQVKFQKIGNVIEAQRVEVSVNGSRLLDTSMVDLRDCWEATSFELEKFQTNHDCVKQEKEDLRTRRTPPYELRFSPLPTAEQLISRPDRPRVAVVREEGSNGDREMAASFYLAGFEPWDVMMTDLMSGSVDLGQFRGMAFVGGFSYADVLDSAKGWAGSIRFNPSLRKAFEEFYSRPDTFSLGVCNGCQLMNLLGWVPGDMEGGGRIPDKAQPRFIRNTSGRLESRYVAVKIAESPSIMLRGMAGSTLPVWCVHGEGRAYFPDPKILTQIKQNNLIPLQFVDDDNAATERYPFNPNGSPGGIAGLCSQDGRHLAMMPHPERLTKMWQFSYVPENWHSLKASPWLQMFQNARMWCEQTV